MNRNNYLLIFLAAALTVGLYMSSSLLSKNDEKIAFLKDILKSKDQYK
jgi:hypothetical protein